MGSRLDIRRAGLVLVVAALASVGYVAMPATRSGAQALGEYGVTEACSSGAVAHVAVKIGQKPKVCPVSAAEQAKKQELATRVTKVAKKAADSFEAGPPLARDAGRIALQAIDTYVTVVQTADPPDPNFKARVRPRVLSHFTVSLRGHRALARAIHRLLANTARVQEYWSAGFLAMERGLGAYQAKNKRWRRIQAADAARFYSIAGRYALRGIPQTRAEVKAFRAAGIHIRRGGTVFPNILASRLGLGIFQDVHTIMGDAAYLARALKLGYVASSSGPAGGGGLGLGI